MNLDENPESLPKGKDVIDSLMEEINEFFRNTQPKKTSEIKEITELLDYASQGIMLKISEDKVIDALHEAHETYSLLPEKDRALEGKLNCVLMYYMKTYL
jgi:hypothetical protein